LPEKLGVIMANSGDIRVIQLPFPSPTYRVTQNWHERYSRDPANIWLRRIVAEVFMVKMEPKSRRVAKT